MEKNKVSIEDYRKFMQDIEKIERKYGIISVTNENIYTIISIFTNCDEEFLSGVYALALEEKRSTFANKLYKIIHLKRFVELYNAFNDKTIDSYLKKLDLKAKSNLMTFVLSNFYLTEDKKKIISLLSESIKKDIESDSLSEKLNNVTGWMDDSDLEAFIPEDIIIRRRG